MSLLVINQQSCSALTTHELDKIRGQLSETEDCIDSVEDLQGSHTAQLSDLQSLVQSLMRKMEDVENRQRRNNIRVVGLPEMAVSHRHLC